MQVRAQAETIELIGLDQARDKKVTTRSTETITTVVYDAKTLRSDYFASILARHSGGTSTTPPTP